MISVTIIVKNGQRLLQKVLCALQAFDEVVVVDMHSTDATVAIAKTFSNVTLYQRNFIGFGPAHNEAARLAKHDWILSLDADEVASQDLVKEIQALSLDPEHVYALPFYNFFNGKRIRWCGWSPESHVRLYNRKKTRFSEELLHEKVHTEDCKIGSLNHPVYHYSYDTISDFLTKMERYSTLFALQYQKKKKSSPGIALYHALGAFFKSYFLKRGFLGGYEGFLISTYNAHTAFYKYLKLYHANR